MEYFMVILIIGECFFLSLVGVFIYELMYFWYQMILGINESFYVWMDEGFIFYVLVEIINFLREEGMFCGCVSENFYVGLI